MPERPIPHKAHNTVSLLRWGTLGILAFWLAVMAGLYLAMDYVRQPRAAVVAADGALVIARGSDGHFRVAGSVNGQPVRFMVDTGASLIAVSDALAQQAGLQGGQVTQFRTANGVRSGRVVAAQSVAVGAFVVSRPARGHRLYRRGGGRCVAGTKLFATL